MSRKPFVKITEEDIIIARQFFEDENLLKDWLYNVVQYYMGNKPIHNDKLEEKYFNSYKKTMNYIIQAKDSGKKGYSKRSENQEDTHIPFKGTSRVLQGVFKGSSREPSKGLQANNKKETINNKSEIINPFEDNDEDLFTFDKFWDLYDKKTGKAKCEPKWEKLKPKEKERIMEVLPDYIKSRPDKQFRKDPLSWLNGRHWEDEIETKSSNTNSNFTEDEQREMQRIEQELGFKF